MRSGTESMAGEGIFPAPRVTGAEYEERLY